MIASANTGDEVLGQRCRCVVVAISACTGLPEPAFDLAIALSHYGGSDARERAMVSKISSFVAAHEDAFERTLLIGHVTGSAWIVSRDGSAVLLLHHRKLDRWLQPGGHSDGDGDTRHVALREAIEESGLTSLVAVDGEIFDVDVHAIPQRGREPAHDHYDVRFAFFADRDEAPQRNAESYAVAWIPLAEIERYDIDESVRRLVAKTPSLFSRDSR